MQTVMILKKNTKLKLFLNIFFGFNTPFILWTGYAFLNSFNKSFGVWDCPVKRTFGVCPSCGLTTNYINLLKGNFDNSIFFYIVFSGFIINFIYSMFLVRKRLKVIEVGENLKT